MALSKSTVEARDGTGRPSRAPLDDITDWARWTLLSTIVPGVELSKVSPWDAKQELQKAWWSIEQARNHQCHPSNMLQPQRLC